MDRPLSQFGGRRFLLCLGCGIACTGLVFLGKIDAGTFRDIIIATIGAYITGSTWQKIKSRGGEVGDP
ncbi:MAG: hypothetical protein CMN85_10790 [Spongiibacteraceae bacterium]|uniref:hypothetical protein n=1 Tax=uncultured Haliea sp. TaxID=622616 RepID=UPI000C4DD9D7|nr:hypothetical protein [Spongiibacteraceae bacterium]|tara:strand:+ start:11504 stop:11707 length:204 start_codon:yes stop_codon:yes gene_type:complete